MIILLMIFAFSACTGKETESILQIHIVSGMRSFLGIAEGFTDKIQELGYEEGKNIRFFLHEGISGSEQEREILERIAAEKADLVLAFPTGTAVAAKKALKGSVPLVFGLGNIEGTGLVDTVQHPGGNTTGVRVPSNQVVLKRFEYLLQLLPDARRIFTAYDPDYEANRSVIPELEKAAIRAGIVLVQARVSSVEELKAELEAREKRDEVDFDGILVTSDTITQSVNGWPLLSEFAARHRIPVSGGISNQLESGAVLTYAVDFHKTGGIAAILADKILKGSDAGTVPVATAGISLQVNYRLASELGLSVSKVLLNIADRILQ
jgi:putative ABC transport system substrate-binding protein